MRRITRNVALAGVALVAAVGLTVSSASATSMAGFAVSPGGPFVGDAVAPIFTTPNSQFYCDSTHVDGNLQASSADGLGMGEITNIDWTNCTFFGLPYSFTTNATSTPWKIDVRGPHPTIPDAFSIKIRGIQMHVSGLGWCNFDIASPTGGDAEVPGYYVNPSGGQPGHLVITPGGNLTVGNVDPDPVENCFGIYTDGDYVHFEADYSVSPNQTITTMP